MRFWPRDKSGWLPILSGPWNLDEKGAISHLLAEESVSWRITRSVGSLVGRREECSAGKSGPSTILSEGARSAPEHRPHPVRERLLNGTLSLELQTSMDGSTLAIGSGTGEPCAVCDQPITTDQVKDIYYDPNLVARARTVAFHAGLRHHLRARTSRHKDAL